MGNRLASALVALALATGGGSAGGDPLEGPAAPQGESPESCGERAVSALQQRYESVRDLTANIVQTTRSVAMGRSAARSMVSRGTVVLQKPGKMRWAYAEPEPSVVISNGESLWIYDPAFREAQKFPSGDGYLSGAAVQFLLGEGDMRRDFAIRALTCSEQRAELELIPRADASYERLLVEVDPAQGELRKTTVFFVLGNVTEVAFSDIRTNLDPAAETFEFDPPEGVRVIELPEGPL